MGARPKTKLWLGFGLMCAAVIIWLVAVNSMMTATRNIPQINQASSQSQVLAAMTAMQDQQDMVTTMVLGYGTSSIVFIAGIVLTIMGLIEFAAEVRARE
jgi:beta-lactamase regulating signal transducer with metallopeptidase domain